MKDFSTIAAHLNDLTKKGVEFVWGVEQDIAFDTLKSKLRNNSKLNVMLVV